MKIFLAFGLVAVLGVLGCNKTSQPSKQVGNTAVVGDVMVEMQTSAGKIVIKLDAEKAPKSVENFLSYVNDGFYDGTIFHRIIDGFMIQGGGFTSAMEQKETKDPIQNEASNGLSNKPMTLAMARTNDPHSATSQFFINVGSNERLDYIEGQSDGYAVFGEVVEGQDIVKKLAKVETGNSGPYQNVPTEAVVIEKVTVKK